MNKIILTLLLSICVLLSADAFGFQASQISRQVGRSIEMRERKCDLAGTRRNSLCNTVSKSRAHTHKVQMVNLQTRKLWWEEGNKFVKLRVTTRTLKTIKKKGLDATAKQYGVNLNKFSMSSGTAKPVAV